MPDEYVSHVTALEYITMHVSDVAASITFYGETFGFKIVHQSQHFALLELPNLNLGLHVGNPNGASNVNLHLRVADLDKAYEDLLQRGIIFKERPKSNPGGFGPRACRTRMVTDSS